MCWCAISVQILMAHHIHGAPLLTIFFFKTSNGATGDSAPLLVLTSNGAPVRDAPLLSIRMVHPYQCAIAITPYPLPLVTFSPLPFLLTHPPTSLDFDLDREAPAARLFLSLPTTASPLPPPSHQIQGMEPW